MSEPGGLRDERGCLTEQGLATMRRSPPGQGPSELVDHLVSCGRCQTRLLAKDPETLGPGKRRRKAPSMARLAAFGTGGLLLMVLAFLLLAWLS